MDRKARPPKIIKPPEVYSTADAGLKDMSFAACERCNAVSRRGEAVLAFVKRLNYTEAELSQEQIGDWRRTLAGIRRNFPQLTELLTANQKRAFLKERGIDRPANAALADLPMIALNRETIDNAFSRSNKTVRH